MSDQAPAAENGGVRLPAGSLRRWLTPRRMALALLVVAVLLAARSCQQSQIRITQQQAIELARQQVSFEPTRTQVRLVRQGLSSHPFWAVSLSVPRRAGANGGFRHLVVVRVDANSGKVAAVTRPDPSPGGG